MTCKRNLNLKLLCATICFHGFYASVAYSQQLPQITLGQTLFPSETTFYKDTQNSYPDAQVSGYVLKFNGKFQEAYTIDTDSKQDPFFYNEATAKNDIRNYTWPKSGIYSKGQIRNASEQTLRIGSTQDVSCSLSVRAGVNATPPAVFPPVQMNSSSPNDHEFTDGQGSSYAPKRYEHTIRVEFSGGYINCQVWDLSPKKSWSIGDITNAFGDSLLSFSRANASVAQNNRNYSTPQQKVTTEAIKVPLTIPTSSFPVKDNSNGSAQRGI